MINSRIKDVDRHFDEIISQSNNKFKIIQENIKSLSNQFEQEKLKEEHYSEKKMNYIKLLENKINERFDDERAKREDAENRIFTLINNRFNILFNELNNECHNRNICVENLKLYLDTQNKDNPDLTHALIKEKNNRIDNDKEIQERINQEFKDMENIIKEEKNIREQTEQAMMDTVKNMINNNKYELKKEKKSRKSAEDTILSLIEDTISKINELDDYDNNSNNEED